MTNFTGAGKGIRVSVVGGRKGLLQGTKADLPLGRESVVRGETKSWSNSQQALSFQWAGSAFKASDSCGKAG